MNKTDSRIMALSLRPTRLSDLVGQKTVATAIAAQMQKRQPRAIMLHGPAGCGKTTLAYIIATSVQCAHQESWGNPCDACLANSWKLDITEINAADTNGVDDVRRIAELAQYRPIPPSLKKVIILDEAHMLTGNAQNLLLKPTESAPEHMLWIICTTVPAKIIPTLRRRFVTYAVKALSYADTRRLLIRAAKRHGIKKPMAPLIEAVNANHVASPALLLMALEKYAAGVSPEAAAAGVDATPTNTLAICKAVGNGDWRGLVAAMGKAPAEEARYIRASVLGWLRGMLLRESNSGRQAAIARAIKDLAGAAPLEDAVLLQWLWGTLHLVCRDMRTRG